MNRNIPRINLYVLEKRDGDLHIDQPFSILRTDIVLTSNPVFNISVSATEISFGNISRIKISFTYLCSFEYKKNNAGPDVFS